MKQTQDRRLILFYRAPVPGEVKTRLAADIGKQAALEAYRGMLSDILDQLSPLQELWLPMVDRPIEDLPADQRGPFAEPRIQRGENLFDRMCDGFERAFADGAHTALLMGTDIPQIHLSHIEWFLKSMETHDACIGPAPDGGYYLIGFHRDRFVPEVFHRPTPPAERARAETVLRMKAAGLRVAVGETLRDIDTLEDLNEAVFRNGGSCCTNVFEASRRLGVVASRSRE
jgi:hypothetical protein